MAGCAPRRSVTLIGREGCHLCGPARQIVSEVTAEFGLGFDYLSLDDRPDLEARYRDLIPVVLIDGHMHQYWRIDRQRLAGVLRPTTAAQENAVLNLGRSRRRH
ncbi:MAG: NrdH-redoxin [Micrococcales bacterium]|nr:MAG: NrdH-redoxin [Micrococcales bacterium]